MRKNTTDKPPRRQTAKFDRAVSGLGKNPRGLWKKTGRWWILFSGNTLKACRSKKSRLPVMKL